MPESPPPSPPSPAISTVSVPPLTSPSPSPSVNRISTTLSTFQDEFRYSLPVVLFETVWHVAFIVATVITLLCTLNEKPIVLLRVWLTGRSLQHGVCLMNRRVSSDPQSFDTSNWIPAGFRFVRSLEKPITMIFENWSLIGFIWVVNDYKTLLSGAPRLLWLTKVVLASELFVGLLHRFFLFLRNLSNLRLFSRYQRRASPAEINILPKYKFQVSNDEKQPDGRARRMVPMSTNGLAFSAERVLQAEDSRCCICFCNYEDGAKLNSLPCKHHFHAPCLFKWLRVKATCPLCKHFFN